MPEQEIQAPRDLLPIGRTLASSKRKRVVWLRHMEGLTQTESFRKVYNRNQPWDSTSACRLFSRKDMQEYQAKLLAWMNNNVINLTSFTRMAALKQLLRIAKKAEDDNKYSAATTAIATACAVVGYREGGVTINQHLSDAQANLAANFFKKHLVNQANVVEATNPKNENSSN